MRSKASFKGHPIHPMLIAFPIAFLTGAVFCDLLAVLFGSEPLWATGAWLAAAGIVTGLIAAVPGVIDYIYTVPPESSGKNRATWHMLVNSGALTLFALGWIVRGGVGGTPSIIVLLLEVVGMALLGVGGWMGGTLVYRNMIAVDHRFAEAGKWSEQRFDADSSGDIEVAKVEELAANQMKLLRFGERRIVLARTESEYVAFEDRCSHRGGSLAGGVMMCGRVQCLWHGSQFDVQSGTVCAGPAEKPIATYRIEERNGSIHLHL